jgi:hypothetical protein
VIPGDQQGFARLRFNMDGLEPGASYRFEHPYGVNTVTAEPAGSTWTFTTGPAPTVTARSAAPNATAVSRTANVTATFSEAVTGTSATTFTLRNATTNAAITAVVSYNATTRVATLNPGATLAANTRFTAALTTGIRDAGGNPTPATSWSFTTGP